MLLRLLYADASLFPQLAGQPSLSLSNEINGSSILSSYELAMATAVDPARRLETFHERSSSLRIPLSPRGISLKSSHLIQPMRSVCPSETWWTSMYAWTERREAHFPHPALSFRLIELHGPSKFQGILYARYVQPLDTRTLPLLNISSLNGS